MKRCFASARMRARRRFAKRCQAICVAVPATRPSCRLRLPPSCGCAAKQFKKIQSKKIQREHPMLDLGTTFLAAVEREPGREAIVDGDVRLTYADYYKRISGLVASFDRLELKPGDHLVSALRNSWQAAVLHWACQFTGVILPPVNWRSKADDVNYAVQDSEARAIVFEDVSAEGVRGAELAANLPRVTLDECRAGEISFADLFLHQLDKLFQPDLLVYHYCSSEVYTCTIDQNARLKPGSAGKSGINQMIRVVKLDAKGPDDIAPRGEEGQIIALLAGDEACEGYWRRPEADAKSLRDGWFFGSDTGYFDKDGDLFVTGRLDDMIISGGENVSPVEIESMLSLHPAVSEVAVVGLPDERWGKVVTAFIAAKTPVTAEDLDTYCAKSTLANFKRPRKFVFVREIPKSPVGKLLRRKLVAGEYETVTP